MRRGTGGRKARKRISARAASAFCAFAAIPAEKTVARCASSGFAPA